MAGLSGAILVVNAGSSTLKLRLLDEADRVVRSADLGADDRDGLGRFCAEAGPVDRVGHRVVHGGRHLVEPTLIDDAVRAVLVDLVPLAPLHQPAAIAGIEAVTGALPGVPAVACFDTAFHATLPTEAATYPLPRAWRERFGLRRFGFHGLSHAYASRRGFELAGDGARRVVTCHLGAGSSLAAVVDGVSVDTTMGFTPNEGLPMATRSGSMDAGLLVWLLRSGLSVDDLDEGLQHHAGLTGVAGEGDMRRLRERAAGGDADAQLAIDLWLHRLAQGVAAMAAAAGGLDLLVFTGGVGEAAADLRAAAAARLGWLGVEVDLRANDEVGEDDALVSPAGARPAVAVVHAREDIEIARATRALVLP